LSLDVVETLPSAILIVMGQTVNSSNQIASTDNSTVDKSAAGLAHEIRNPLAIIKGVADTFLQRGHLSRQDREWMEAVRRAVLTIEAQIRERLED